MAKNETLQKIYKFDSEVKLYFVENESKSRLAAKRPSWKNLTVIPESLIKIFRNYLFKNHQLKKKPIKI